MVISAIKKLEINNEFEEVLKETAYDCDINSKGNIIRLEEIIRPLPNGNYQIIFKNSLLLKYYFDLWRHRRKSTSTLYCG